MDTPAQGETKACFALEAAALSVDRSGKRVLSEISFDVRAGEVYALLGGNGAGKSTTLLAFLGLLAPVGGTACVQGLDVVRHTEKVRSLIAYLPETAALYPHLSAIDNLSYFLALARCACDSSARDRALDQVGLPKQARAKRLATYSKGMRQKVAIALAMLRNTPILLLDEPTSGLDPKAIDDLNALLRSLADMGRTVLMVTHDVFGACRIADRISFLQEGQLVGTLAASERGPIDPQAAYLAFAGKAAYS